MEEGGQPPGQLFYFPFVGAPQKGERGLDQPYVTLAGVYLNLPPSVTLLEYSLAVQLLDETTTPSVGPSASLVVRRHGKPLVPPPLGPPLSHRVKMASHNSQCGVAVSQRTLPPPCSL